MTWRALMIALLFVLFATCVVLPSPIHGQAYAQDEPPTGTATGNNAPIAATGDPETHIVTDDTNPNNPTKCEDLEEAQGGALLGKIVPCLTYTIEQSTVAFTSQFVAWLSPLFYTFLLLVVTLYGVRVLANEPEVYKQGILLLVKIAVVATILADLGNTSSYDGSGGGGKLIPAVYGVMNEAQSIVSNTLTSTELSCEWKDYKGPKTQPVWAMMDCVMGKLYGFTVGTDGKPSMLLMTSVAGLLTGFLFGGAWGVAVFFGMIAVLFSMFMLVVRTVVSFLIGYLVVCLMLIMAPLLLPLTFLRGTAPYFESYWRTILGAFLTPVIITAYSMFALIVYDKMLFSTADSPMGESIVAKLFKFDNIKDAVQPTSKLCDHHYTNDALDVRLNLGASMADKDKMMSFPKMHNLSLQTLGGDNDLCNPVKAAAFRLDKMKDADPDKHKDLTAIFMELVNLFILAYLMSQGQELLPGIVTQLVGRSATTRGVQEVIENDGKYSRAYQSAMQTAMSKFRKNPDDSKSGYESGGDYAKHFLRNMTNATNDSRAAYFNTLKNNTVKKP